MSHDRAEKARLLEIGQVHSPAFFGTQYHGGIKVKADATYLRADTMVGLMYSVPWSKLYECISMKCLANANELVGQIERCGFEVMFRV